MLVEKVVTVNNKYGLHARPAVQFVEMAGKFASVVTLIKGAKVADAKSVMSVLTLAAVRGTQLVIRAEGRDAEEAAEALRQLITSKFDEE